MADAKTTELSQHATAPARDDLLPLVDVDDTSMAASGTNKKIAVGDLLARVYIEESADFQIDPTVHVDGCFISVAGASYPATRTITLPAPADNPDGQAYSIEFTVAADSGVGITIAWSGGSTTFGFSGEEITLYRLTYLGEIGATNPGMWLIEFLHDFDTVSTYVLSNAEA